MANKSIFSAAPRGVTPPPVTTVNEAGGVAYKFEARHALAQFAVTGTLNDQYYSTAEEQLAKVIELCAEVEPTFIAKTAIYAREQGKMKDMPALLCAYLAVKDVALLKQIFPRVIDNAKMLRNFVQMIRSGKLGRKSLGTAPKKLVQSWFASKTDDQIFRQSIGSSPSMGDIIKMARPKPADAQRRALFGYLAGIDSIALEAGAAAGKVERNSWGLGYDTTCLPALVAEYEAFKAKAPGTKLPVPKVPWEMLTALPLTDSDWQEIAVNATWTQTRMNLNTFARHGVFKSPELVKLVADRLRNREEIAKAKLFPYQLLAAYLNTEDVPQEIRLALQDAMEIAIENVPVVDGQIVVMPDISGSMHSPITGHRAGATSKVRCIDVAALVAAVFMRRNPLTEVIPFAEGVRKVDLNPRDSVMTNAEKLMKQPGGGTNCSAPLAELNARKAKADLLVYVSDNESWMDSARATMYGRATGTMGEWNQFKARNPKAKLVCIDIQSNDSTQAKEQTDILNVGGFSDAVFDTIARFVGGGDIAKPLTADHWVGVINEVVL